MASGVASGMGSGVASGAASGVASWGGLLGWPLGWPLGWRLKAVGMYVPSFGFVRVGTHCLSVVLHDQLGVKFT